LYRDAPSIPLEEVEGMLGFAMELEKQTSEARLVQPLSFPREIDLTSGLVAFDYRSGKPDDRSY
jgi:predicted DNA-binding transcriptional regulator AlpA